MLFIRKIFHFSNFFISLKFFLNTLLQICSNTWKDTNKIILTCSVKKNKKKLKNKK